MTDYNEYLNIAVLQENKPVTYKSLARAVGIHVNKAKQALYEFSEAQSNVRAVYCITGISLKNTQFSIQLVKEAELEEAKKGYKEISGVHVYSITSFDPDDFSIFYNACRDGPKLAIEDRVKCGILKNPNVVLRSIGSTNRTTSTSTESKSPAISNTKPLSSTATNKPTAAPASAKKAKPTAKPPVTSSTAAKRKGTLNFGPATTKKQAVATPAKAEEPTPKPVAKKSINKMKPKNENDDLDVRMAKTSIKASDIFSDDEDEDQEDEEEEDQANKPQQEEDLDIEPEEEDTKMEVDEEEAEEASTASSPNASSPAPAAAPGKARRKVLKKKTTKNSRGFLVTEEVWEWEEVDEDEVESSTPTPAVKSKPTPSQPTKKHTKAIKNDKKPTGQSNLLSFFKKA